MTVRDTYFAPGMIQVMWVQGGISCFSVKLDNQQGDATYSDTQRPGLQYKYLY